MKRNVTHEIYRKYEDTIHHSVETAYGKRKPYNTAFNALFKFHISKEINRVINDMGVNKGEL